MNTSTDTVLTRAEQWARTWGEVVNKTTAAQMLNISMPTLYKYINAGHISQAVDGRLFTREIADYMENPPRQKRQSPNKGHPKKWTI